MSGKQSRFVCVFKIWEISEQCHSVRISVNKVSLIEGVQNRQESEIKNNKSHIGSCC